MGTTWLVRAQAISPFKVREVRFDESVTKKPSAHVPKNWKFVGVQRGPKVNESYLWFQDGNGNLFLVRGFVDENSDRFVLRDEVQEVVSEQ